MAKSNKQIQDEYADKSALARVGIAADDLVRIAAGGLTGGMLDSYLGGDNAERTREAKVRAGLAGDVVNVGGMALGLKGAGQALKGAVGAVRAAPAALALAPSAGAGTALRYLTGTAGPGLIPAAAAGAKVSKGALAKGAGLLGLFGLSAAGRQDETVAPAAAVARTPAAAKKAAPVAEAAPRAPTAQDRAMAAIDTILRQPFTIDEFATASGALPEVAASASKVSNKDKVFGAASGIADTLYQVELQKASQLAGDARDQAVLDATERYRQNLLETLGVDPSKQALAQILAAQQAGE